MGCEICTKEDLRKLYAYRRDENRFPYLYEVVETKRLNR